MDPESSFLSTRKFTSVESESSVRSLESGDLGDVVGDLGDILTLHVSTVQGEPTRLRTQEGPG